MRVDMLEEEDSSMESEIPDSDTELQAALAEGKLKPGLYSIAPHVKREHVNNPAALNQKLEEIKLDMDWIQRLDMANVLAPVTPELKAQFGDLDLRKTKKGAIDDSDKVDVHHDFKREMTFYRQAQSAVMEGISRLAQLGLSTKRPEDYFAQMAKSDDHMQKVREKLLSKKTSMEIAEKVRKRRELKKLGKKIQVEVLQRRQKEKKDMLENLKKYKKGQQSSLEFLDNKPSINNRKGAAVGNSQNNKPGGMRNKRAEMKRKYKDMKYGYGGQKKRSKYNTSESCAMDMGSSGKGKRFGKKGGAGGGGKGAQRPGKMKRQKLKSRQNRS